jgi:hypothetical protein
MRKAALKQMELWRASVLGTRKSLLPHPNDDSRLRLVN